MSNLLKYAMVKRIIQNLIKMIFYFLQNDKLLLKVNNLIIMKKKLVIFTINPLVCDIFSKICL